MTLETRSANKQASKGQLIMMFFSGSCESSCCTEEKCDFFIGIEHRLREHEAQQSLNQLSKKEGLQGCRSGRTCYE